MTYQQWLADAAKALNQVNPTENGKVDALVLLQHATGKSRTQILAFDETEIDEKVRLKNKMIFEMISLGLLNNFKMKNVIYLTN